MIAEGVLVFGVHDLELADIEEQSAAPEDSSSFNRGAASTECPEANRWASLLSVVV